MAAAGIALALGSDSPVTPLDPWGSVRAAVRHRTPGSGLDPVAAFDAHTRGGWWAARRDADGVVAAGAPATFAVWDVDELDPATGLPPLEAADDAPALPRTVVRGTTVIDRDARADARACPCQRRLPDGVLCGERSALFAPPPGKRPAMLRTRILLSAAFGTVLLVVVVADAGPRRAGAVRRRRRAVRVGSAGPPATPHAGPGRRDCWIVAGHAARGRAP